MSHQSRWTNDLTHEGETPFIYGTHWSDTIARTGQGLVVLASAGADNLTITNAQGFERIGNWVSGGTGNDTMQVLGSYNWVSGGAGADRMTLSGDPDQSTSSSGNVVYGDGGDDWILSRTYGSTIYGGSGRDEIHVPGIVSGNIVHGGTGNDLLTVIGNENQLFGGEGDDVLRSASGVGWETQDFPHNGSILSGGPGFDRFELTNASILRGADDGDGILSEGENLTGVIDQIDGYGKGEVLAIDATIQHEGPVAVIEAYGPYNERLFRPLLEPGEYALLHGNNLGDGSFVIAGSGPDTLILYHSDDTGGGIYASGSLILNGNAGGGLVFA
jgi:Ca2+-binding RTX toxin-like protein